MAGEGYSSVNSESEGGAMAAGRALFYWLALSLLLIAGISWAAPMGPLYNGQSWQIPYFGSENLPVAADFNGDGILDFLITSPSRNALGILFGNGDGSFQNYVALDTGLYGSVGGPIVGDFNNDGNTDVAVFGGGGISILLGDGAGNLHLYQTISENCGLVHMTTADFNRDGNLDIAANCYYGTTVVLLGNGDGTFQISSTITLNSNVLQGIASSDLNGDKIPDLVIVGVNPDSAIVLLGNGDGTFQPEVDYPVGSFPEEVDIGDFNGDGHPDFIVTNSNSYDISLLINNGDGTFEPEQRHVVGNTPWSGAFKDVNGDGYEDYVVSVFGSRGEIYFGNADGVLQSPQYVPLIGGIGIGLADLDGDGNADLYTCLNSDAVSVLRGNGDGTFAGPEQYPTDMLTPESIAHGDVNGDGIMDLAAGDPQEDKLTVYLGEADGTFKPDVELQSWGYVRDVAMADVNGDGNADILTAEWDVFSHDGVLGVYLSNGDGTFKPEQTYAAGEGSIKIVTGDLNGDGVPDAIVTNDDGTVADSVGVFINNGDGTFQPRVTYTDGNWPGPIALADFNGDGMLDLAVLDAGGLSIFTGNGDGTFGPADTHGYGGVAGNAMIATDLDGDGNQDLVGSDLGDVFILFGNGDGTFQTVQKLDLREGATSYSVAVTDEDSDGNKDIVVPDLDRVTVLFGDGNRGFARREHYYTGGGYALTALDANGDGRPDIALVGGATLSVLLHLAPRLAFGDLKYTVSGDNSLNDYVSASDPGGLQLSYGVLAQPHHGTLILETDGSFSYTPDTSFTGIDTFRVTATDGNSTASGVAVIQVITPTAPTIAGLPGSIVYDQGQSIDPMAFSLSGSGSLNLNATSSNADLLPVRDINWNEGCGTDTKSCTLTLIPDPTKTGFAKVTLTVTDGFGQSDSESMGVEIYASPPPPGGGGSGGSGGNSSGGGGAIGAWTSLSLTLLYMVMLPDHKYEQKGGR